MPRDLDEAPTGEHLKQLYDHCYDGPYWSPQRSFDERMLELFFDDNRIRHPDTANKNRLRRIDPERMASAESARVTELLISLYPNQATVGVRDLGEKPRGEGKIERVEVALNECLDQMNPPTDAPYDAEVWQMGTVGRTAHLGPICGGDYWWDFPYKEPNESEGEWQKRYGDWRRKAPLPLIHQDLPADMTVAPSFGSITDEVMSVMSLMWYDVIQMFSVEEIGKALGNDYEQSENFKFGEPVDLVIHSNCRWLTYALKGREGGFLGTSLGRRDVVTPMRQIEHKLGRTAIRILPGNTTGRKEPGRFWWPLIMPAASKVEAYDRMGSMIMTGIKGGAFPLWRAWLTNPGSAEAQARINQAEDYFQLDPGEAEAGKPRENIEPLQIQTVSPAMIEMYREIGGQIARMTGAHETMEGVISASAPAWAVSYSSEQAQRRLSRFTKAVAELTRDNAEGIICAAVAFGEPIDLATKEGRITLDPEELYDLEAMIKVELKPKVPVNRRADYDLFVSLTERILATGAPLNITRLAEELAGEEQPFTAIKENAKWKFLTSEPVQNAAIQHYLDYAEVDIEADLGVSIDQMMGGYPNVPMELKAMLAGQAPGGNGVNPETQGAITAASPFSRAPGGPVPMGNATDLGIA